MSEVVLKNIHKSYGDTKVLKGVDLDINDGEFIVIVGPSGCGKSTLLRSIAGLEEIQSGEISIANRKVTSLPPKDRNIAMVFQNYALYPHMTVYNNMAYGLKNRKVPKAEIKKRVYDVAQMLKLEEYLNRKPKELSGGQRQRVAMGRAIVRKPDVFLFDEPLSNLDASLRNEMRVEIKKLQKMLNITSIYVTHDQVEAMTLADKLIVMEKGEAVQIGTALSIYEKPATPFVASFIGSPSMNLYQLEQDQKNKKASLSNGYAVDLPKALKLSDHSILMGMRPEHFTLKQKNKTDFKISITIELIENLGADTIIHGTFDQSKKPLIVRLEGGEKYNFGDKLELFISQKNIYFFSDNKLVN